MRVKRGVVVLRCLAAGVALLIAHAGLSAEVDHYKLPPPVSKAEHTVYYPRLVELALSKTREDFGPYRISIAEGVTLATGRIARELFRGEQVNVIWTMATECLKNELRPIKIPLLKGANGYRLFLIKDGNQPLFDDVKDLQDLAGLKAGQAKHWPDTPIMRRNGLTVVSSNNYESLIKMLMAERFDYFPRGAYEIFAEHAEAAGTAIEKRFALSYQAPIYFFLSPAYERLAHRLEVGLKRAQQDGSFDRLFNSIPSFRKAQQAMLDPDRRVFELTADVDCAFD